MSYQRMDHAAWLSDVLKRPVEGDEARIADLVGITFNGLYNAPINFRNGKGWQHKNWRDHISVTALVNDMGTGFSTFDFDGLTMLVFLCHEARIRCHVVSHTRHCWRMTFTPRQADGGMSRRHPNLDEAVDAFRAYLPAGHRILYREKEQAA